MRYWLYLAAKLTGALVLLYGLLVGVEHLFKIPPPPWWDVAVNSSTVVNHSNPQKAPDGVVYVPLRPREHPKQTSMFLHDMPFTFAIIAVWLFSAGVLYLIVWDHRRRCRSCFRRLIMPVATGSWGHMFTFGRPATEWICPYGHGTLRVDELQITGKELADWEAHDDDIWKELESYK